MITAIVPAYNEELRIQNVLKVLNETELVHEIIVVNDCSIDNTFDVAIRYTKNVVNLDKNVGKGGAIIEGIKRANGNVILLLDADLIGLKSNHIIELLKPIIVNEVDSTVGIFSSGRFFTDLAQKIAPFLSGQRAIKKEILTDIRNLEVTRYGFEIAISNYLKEMNIKTKRVILQDMTHVMKEEKNGIVKGFLSRLRMYWEIFRVLSFKIGR